MFSDDIAIREKKFGIWRTKTWRKCYNEVKFISLGLQEKGVKIGSTIGLLGNNTPRWIIGEIAAQSIKCSPMGIYSDALENEIDYLLNHSSCGTVFVEDEEQADKILSLSNSEKKVRLIIFDEEKQTAEDFSKYSDTISYEILTSISQRIRRTYLSD